MDKNLKGSKILLRPSMKKFQTEAFPKLGICGFSKPYTIGNLNRQIIYLLFARKVPDEDILEVQKDYYDLVSNMLEDSEAAIDMLLW